jgi:hypothetical protein
VRHPISRLKKTAASLMLSVLLPVMCIDASPELTLYHRQAKNWVDPITDILGIWQGSWSLFAKNPDRLNTRVTWICTLEGGDTFEGSSPHWEDLNLWQRWTHFRSMEFFDAIRADKNRAAWKGFAHFLKDKCESDGSQAQSIRLIRHWAEIPAYSGPSSVVPRPYTRYEKSYTYYEERFD